MIQGAVQGFGQGPFVLVECAGFPRVIMWRVKGMGYAKGERQIVCRQVCTSCHVCVHRAVVMVTWKPQCMSNIGKDTVIRLFVQPVRR
jgi:hypothetical protein